VQRLHPNCWASPCTQLGWSPQVWHQPITKAILHQHNKLIQNGLRFNF
jgi:hypothetical protein